MNKFYIDMIINAIFIVGSFFGLIFVMDNFLQNNISILNHTLRLALIILIYIGILVIFAKKRLPLDSPIMQQLLKRKIKFLAFTYISALIIIAIMLLANT